VSAPNHYEVSSLGRVRRISSGRILKPRTDRYGYYHYSLSVEGRVTFHTGHSLVSLAFFGPRPKGTEICHGDGNPQNNSIANLRYDTHSANMLDSIKHGTHHAIRRKSIEYDSE